jgi:hypothetical protein
VGEIGDGIQIHEKSPTTQVTISGNPSNVRYLQYCTWNNTVHDNHVMFEAKGNGVTGALYEKMLPEDGSPITQPFENCTVDPRNGDIDQLNASVPFFDARRVLFSRNTYTDDISSAEKRWQWGMNDEKTGAGILYDYLLGFSGFQMQGQDLGSTLLIGSPPPVSEHCQ